MSALKTQVLKTHSQKIEEALKIGYLLLMDEDLKTRGQLVRLHEVTCDEEKRLRIVVSNLAGFRLHRVLFSFPSIFTRISELGAERLFELAEEHNSPLDGREFKGSSYGFLDVPKGWGPTVALKVQEILSDPENLIPENPQRITKTVSLSF